MIEEELAKPTTFNHNGGSGSTSVNMKVPNDVEDYAREFVRIASRGDWRSLRCFDELNDTKSLQMEALNLR